MDFKWPLAFLLAIIIGGVCRWFEVPAPAPPSLLGGLLVFSTSFGYWAAGYFFKL